jgi:uncharacterized radical SAM superfamily Fe-S cluster-containing enzyme
MKVKIAKNVKCCREFGMWGNRYWYTISLYYIYIHFWRDGNYKG